MYEFPQNRRVEHCAFPERANEQVPYAAFIRWKSALVTDVGASGFLRVRRPGTEDDTTVSEGIAYGMILAVVMDDQDLFDELWKYSRQPAYLTRSGLMHWKILSSGEVAIDGKGSATDADQDMAWALIQADRKWGGRGSLDSSYIDAAIAQVWRVWNLEIVPHAGYLLLPGDSWGANHAFNPSYFAPNQYRAFGEITATMPGWQKVIDAGYERLRECQRAENGNDQNGLMPAWGVDGTGKPCRPLPGLPTHHQYDSMRVSFRLAQDYLDFEEPRAKSYLVKAARFYSGIGISAIADGYELTGIPRPENPGQKAAAFIGSAGVSGMVDRQFQTLVDEAYDQLATSDLCPPSYYYNFTWQVLSLLMLTGNLSGYRRAR